MVPTIFFEIHKLVKSENLIDIELEKWNEYQANINFKKSKTYCKTVCFEL